ncbi:MAG: MFS transporter [Gammaproteobacteria bacterium]|nr:MFS transporter [Gammaproteobacteria bacterium]MXY06750.1 MFS transporter [Gammaproteobacteria bacterium]MYE50078.1 MFS transporter [Gammaproteobacteria bacterium]MYF10363.1 MFS transporter [Gammaproteobacteria bacterium]MYG12525.1 MFS transporter [Gammaproteobacteria bacterium]
MLATRDLGTALALADFRWLWIGSLASSFAMNMQIVARGWLVYTLTSSALDLAWVTLSFMIPLVAFALLGGVMADRVPKRGIIMLAQGLNSVATILLGVIILAGQVDFWDFIWFGFFNGTVLALSMPARQAMVPELVPERLIFTAMGLTTTSWNLSRILGPAMAGFLIAWIAGGDTTSHFGVGIVYFMIAALYLASSLAMWRVAPTRPSARAEDQHPLRDIADGMRYIWDNPPVLGLILLSIVPFLFGMPINTLLPAYNEDILSGGADDLGLLMSAMGIGAIVGSLMMATMGELRGKGRWLIGTSIAWAGATALVGTADSQLWAVAAVALVGWLSSWNMSLNRGLLQTSIKPTMRGRVLSIDMMSHGLMPLGVIPISLIAEQVNVAVALQVAGGVFALAVVALLGTSRAVRSLA